MSSPPAAQPFRQLRSVASRLGDVARAYRGVVIKNVNRVEIRLADVTPEKLHRLFAESAD